MIICGDKKDNGCVEMRHSAFEHFDGVKKDDQAWDIFLGCYELDLTTNCGMGSSNCRNYMWCYLEYMLPAGFEVADGRQERG
jgi:hypothetical protein